MKCKTPLGLHACHRKKHYIKCPSFHFLMRFSIIPWYLLTYFFLLSFWILDSIVSFHLYTSIRGSSHCYCNQLWTLCVNQVHLSTYFHHWVTLIKESRNPQFGAVNDLYVGQTNSAYISGDAEWNLISCERTKMHVWCCLSFLITEQTCFSPFFMGNRYPIQLGDHIPISIPFSNCFCCPLESGKLSMLYDH